MKKPARKKRTSAHSHARRARCLGLFSRLSEFLDGELDAERSRIFERHLKQCVNCCAFFNTFKKTVELCRRSPNRRVPSGVRRKLHESLERESRRRRAGSRARSRNPPN